MKDLFVLVADKNAHFTLRGALTRYQSIGIRPIDFEFLVHPGRDGGARSSGPDILALRRRQFSRALLVFEFEGSGSNCPDAVALEEELDNRLRRQWEQNAKAIVITPEVDIWMWGSDNLLAEAIGWQRRLRIREWLESEGFEFYNDNKPKRPKEALEAVLREANVRRSSSLYESIASRVSIKRCTDDAAKRLQDCLQLWFPRSHERQ